MRRLPVRDTQLADLQLVGQSMQLDLSPDCQTPAPGDWLVTESYGTWEVRRVLYEASDQTGACVEAELR